MMLLNQIRSMARAPAMSRMAVRAFSSTPFATSPGRDNAKLEKLQAELAPGASATLLTADVVDSKSVEAAIAAAAEANGGKIDGVVNCVGSIVLKPAHSTSDADFDNVIKLNLTSCFNILRSSVKRMSSTGGGSIVFCSSAVAKHGIPNHEAIAAAKAGILGLSLSAAATYAPKNIRVNCVAPGLTRTPLSARITGSPASLKASENMHALKRIGDADEVAAALEFFLNPSNSFITGGGYAVNERGLVLAGRIYGMRMRRGVGSSVLN
eukprot:gene19404-26061_t